MSGIRLVMRAVPLVAAFLALAGCGTAQWPPSGWSSWWGSRPPAAENAPPGAGGMVVVAKGETLYGIARRYQVPVRGLIEVNNLNPPYLLAIGQRLALPQGKVHTVREGESLRTIARQYGADLQTLAQANGLQPPSYPVRTGQQLLLPTSSGAASAPSDPAPQPPSPDSTRVPVASAVLEEPAAPTATPTAARSPFSSPTEEKPAPSAAPIPSGKPATPVAITEPPPREDRSFSWPVEGQLLSQFGSKDKGLQNDGINIAAPRGTPVRAAENGVVAYAGNELRGFGNLLLIKHADGWVTAYAHNDTLLVKRGQSVRRGDIISHVGSTGSVTSPQLHFELRQGKRPVDPQRHLAKRTSGTS